MIWDDMKGVKRRDMGRENLVFFGNEVHVEQNLRGKAGEKGSEESGQHKHQVQAHHNHGIAALRIWSRRERGTNGEAVGGGTGSEKHPRFGALHVFVTEMREREDLVQAFLQPQLVHRVSVLMKYAIDLCTG